MPDDTPIEQRPPVPYLEHMTLVVQFCRLARLLGVEVRDGSTYESALEQCRGRALVAAARADQFDAVLSLLDGAEDALRNAQAAAQFVNAGPDIERARRLFMRALPVLRELATKNP